MPVHVVSKVWLGVLFCASSILFFPSCQSNLQEHTTEWDRVEIPLGNMRALSPDLRWAAYNEVLPNKPTPPALKFYGYQGRIFVREIQPNMVGTPLLVTEYNTAEKINFRVWGFSPDSSKLLVMKRVLDAPNELWVVDVPEVENRELLYQGKSPIRCVQWAPDSQHITVVTVNWGLDLVALDGTVQQDILPSFTFNKILNTVSWSPTGEQFVYPDYSSGEMTPIRIMDLASGEQRTVTTWPYFVDAYWSPAGEYIALHGYGYERKILAVVDTAGQVQFSMPLEEGIEDWVRKPVWSPDGTYLALGVSEQAEPGAGYSYSVMVLTAATWEVRQIPVDSYSEVLAWSPEGAAIIMKGSWDGQSGLLKIPVVPPARPSTPPWATAR